MNREKDGRISSSGDSRKKYRLRVKRLEGVACRRWSNLEFTNTGSICGQRGGGSGPGQPWQLSSRCIIWSWKKQGKPQILLQMGGIQNLQPVGKDLRRKLLYKKRVSHCFALEPKWVLILFMYINKWNLHKLLFIRLRICSASYH